MWHEARKQEKKIRGMMVDYKKRAERRREFYEKTKADPTQFLQLHGRKSKIYIDPSIAMAADSPANMMPWLGQTDNLIDRFDVRAHLDHIPEVPANKETKVMTPEESWEERQVNYERYRILVQNDFLGVSEEKFLHQIHVEEQFGYVVSNQRAKEDEKKKLAEKKAAIAYVYEDSSPVPPRPTVTEKSEETEADEDEEDVSDIDFDLNVDVNQIGPQQAHEINQCGTTFGLVGNDFYSLLTRDLEEQEALRLAREHEEEKAMYSGRKSRRERRAFREKRLLGRKISPPSYAARQSPTSDAIRKSMSKSRSRSHSPINSGQITYITSFGGDDSDSEGHIVQGPVLQGPAPPPAVPAKPQQLETSVKPKAHSRSRSPSLSKRRRRGSGSPDSRSRRSRSRERRHRGRRNRSSSRSQSSSRSRSRSRSRRGRGRDRRRARRRRSSSSSSSTSGSRRRSRSRKRHSSSRSSSRKRSRSLSQKRSRSSSLKRSRSMSRKRSRSASRKRSRSSSRKRSISRSRKRSRSGSKRRSLHSSSSGSSVRSHRSRRHSSSSSSPSPHRSPSPKPLPAPPVKRYYGRKKDDSESLESGSDMDVDTEQPAQATLTLQPKTESTRSNPHKSSASLLGNSGAGTKASFKSSKVTPQELLKKKMQALLNRQYKADKKAEKVRKEKADQERQDREEELREISLKLRRKLAERERRLNDSDDDQEEVISNFGSHCGSPKLHTVAAKPRSRSPSHSKSPPTSRRHNSPPPRRYSPPSRRNKSPSPQRYGRNSHSSKGTSHRDQHSRSRNYSRERDSRHDRYRDTERVRERRRSRERSRSPQRRRNRPLVDY